MGELLSIDLSYKYININNRCMNWLYRKFLGWSRGDFDPHDGDIVLQVNTWKVSGMMASYVRRLIYELWKVGAEVYLKVVDREDFVHSVKLADYMRTAEFPPFSHTADLQCCIRDHVYEASVPVTTRPGPPNGMRLMDWNIIFPTSLETNWKSAAIWKEVPMKVSGTFLAKNILREFTNTNTHTSIFHLSWLSMLPPGHLYYTALAKPNGEHMVALETLYEYDTSQEPKPRMSFKKAVGIFKKKKNKAVTPYRQDRFFV